MITQREYNISWGAVLVFLGITLLAVSLLTRSAPAIIALMGLTLIFASLTLFSAAATGRRRSTLSLIGLITFVFGILVLLSFIATPTVPYFMGIGMLTLAVGELVRAYVSDHRGRRASLAAGIISFLFAVPLFIPTINLLTVIIAAIGVYAIILGILTLFMESPVLKPGEPLTRQPLAREHSSAILPSKTT